MSSRELQASLSLAAIFGLRLFGMFIILPVFALWAQGRPGWDLQLAGIALGAYGLTQALLQIPLGTLSDRHGRKPIMYLGLAFFAAGSFVCAVSESPFWVILGRVIQGGGAISSVAIAAAADLTSEANRTKAMAIIGSTIGAVFAVSFVAAPFLTAVIGVPGIFALTGVFALAAMAVVRWMVPQPEQRLAVDRTAGLARVLRDPELLRLNVGIFALHAVLMATFVVVPLALQRAGVEPAHQWVVYLGALVAGIVLMVPGVVGRAAAHEKGVFLAAIATVAVSLAVLALGLGHLAGIATGLVIFFAGFNVLEAKLPALVSKAAPREARGTATGLYSSVQFLGTFAGGAAGGALAQHVGAMAVLVTCLAAMAAWFAVAVGMGEYAAAAARR
jgi:predicted MFS family arabinose efflux permease